MSDSSEAERLRTGQKLSYGLGAVPFVLAYSALAQLAFPIFNMTLGMSATLVGAALAIGRLWDAFTDPVMGAVSDNTRSRWGRRRPWILLGSILCAVTFPLLWFVPPDWPVATQFAWITFFILFYYTATTVYSVPFLSLGYELNPDPIERTRLQVWTSYFAAAASISLPWVYRGAQSEAFPDTLTGMRWLGIGLGAAFLVFSLPVFLGSRERMDQTATQEAKIPFLRGLKETFANKAFVLLVLGVVTTLLCVPVLVGSLGVYLNSYYIFGGDTKTGAAYAAAFGTFYFVVKLVILPFGVRLTARYGKIRVVRWALVLSFFGAIAQFWLYTPAAPWLQFVSALFLSPALTCFWLLVNPMKADCADYDEWHTGQRRSGTYAAVANWIEKATTTIFLLLSGLMLDLSGFDPDLGGNQPEHTILVWRIAFAAVPAAGYLIALACLHFYPLTDEKMAEIRHALAARTQSA